MNMRLGVILLAVVLLTAYSLPAASAECAEQGGQSCGKAEMSCGGQCSNCSCEGDCAEGCECGCGGQCGQACGKSEGCKMGSGACSKADDKPCGETEATCENAGTQSCCQETSAGCEGMGKGSCESGGEGNSCAKGESMSCGESQGEACDTAEATCAGEDAKSCGQESGAGCESMGDSQACGSGSEMRRGREDRPMRYNKEVYFANERELQRVVDDAVALCPMQKAHLRNALDFSTEFTSDMMQLYYADHGMSMDELNYRMTRMNHETNRDTRDMLNPVQNASFPKHMWALYSNSAWCYGYHPDAHYVMGKMKREHMRGNERMRGGHMQGRFAEPRSERGGEEGCDSSCPK
jgi:hypothetical protein